MQILKTHVVILRGTEIFVPWKTSEEKQLISKKTVSKTEKQFSQHPYRMISKNLFFKVEVYMLHLNKKYHVHLELQSVVVHSIHVTTEKRK